MKLVISTGMIAAYWLGAGVCHLFSFGTNVNIYWHPIWALIVTSGSALIFAFERHVAQIAKQNAQQRFQSQNNLSKEEFELVQIFRKTHQ